jgi:hypothetical protein
VQLDLQRRPGKKAKSEERPAEQQEENRKT